MYLNLILCLAISTGLWALKRLLSLRSCRSPLPPGPPRIPILGNIDQLPSGNGPEWLFWREHLPRYGPVSSLEVLGQTLVIFNNAEAAIEIMERKSSVTRFIPDSTFAKMRVDTILALISLDQRKGGLIYRRSGWGACLATHENTGIWKGIRTNMKREIGTKQLVSRLHPQMDISIRRFLGNVLAAPEQLRDHIRRDVVGFMLNFAYGYNMAPHGEDAFYELTQKAVSQFGQIFSDMNWAVNHIPALQYLPAWFPGAQFARKAAEFRRCTREFTELPPKFVKYKMAQKNFQPSMLSRMLQDAPEPGSEQETAMLWSTIEVYLGGAETNASGMMSFIIAMALYPEVQRKAQEELDRVVGHATLPGFEHRASLPYINAIVKETLRWRPPSPVATPHVAGADLIWNGYSIPKGSYLIANIGTFTRDPAIYKQPMAFRPERFLEEDNHTPEIDPKKYVFGFGRRLCPGRFLADDRLFLFAARFLACFNTAPRGSGPGSAEPKWLPGIITHPEPFDMKIEPRSLEHEVLIRSSGMEMESWGMNDAEDFAKVTL